MIVFLVYTAEDINIHMFRMRFFTVLLGCNVASVFLGDWPPNILSKSGHIQFNFLVLWSTVKKNMRKICIFISLVVYTRKKIFWQNVINGPYHNQLLLRRSCVGCQVYDKSSRSYMENRIALFMLGPGTNVYFSMRHSIWNANNLHHNNPSKVLHPFRLNSYISRHNWLTPGIYKSILYFNISKVIHRKLAPELYFLA